MMKRNLSILFLFFSFMMIQTICGQDSVSVKWFDPDEYPNAPGGQWIDIYEVKDKLLINERGQVVLFTGTGFIPVFQEFNLSEKSQFYQDNDDFLWIVDSTRILKYDGKSISTFSIPNLKKSVHDSRLRDVEILKDINGYLWIAFNYRQYENEVTSEQGLLNLPVGQIFLFNEEDGLIEIDNTVDGMHGIDHIAEIPGMGIYFFYDGYMLDTTYANQLGIGYSSNHYVNPKAAKFSDGKLIPAEPVFDDLSSFSEIVSDGVGNSIIFFNGNDDGNYSGSLVLRNEEIMKNRIPFDLTKYRYVSGIHLTKDQWAISLVKRISSSEHDFAVFDYAMENNHLVISPLDSLSKIYIKNYDDGRNEFSALRFIKRSSIMATMGNSIFRYREYPIYTWDEGQWKHRLDVKTGYIIPSFDNPDLYFLTRWFLHIRFGIAETIRGDNSEWLSQLESSRTFLDNHKNVMFIGRPNDNKTEPSQLYRIKKDQIEKYNLGDSINIDPKRTLYSGIGNIFWSENHIYIVIYDSGYKKHYLKGNIHGDEKDIRLYRVFDEYDQVFFIKGQPRFATRKTDSNIPFEVYDIGNGDLQLTPINAADSVLKEIYDFKLEENINGDLILNCFDKKNNLVIQLNYMDLEWFPIKQFVKEPNELYLGHDEKNDFFYNFCNKEIVCYNQDQKLIVKNNIILNKRNWPDVHQKEDFFYFKPSNIDSFLLIQNCQDLSFPAKKGKLVNVFKINNYFHISKLLGKSQLLIDNHMIQDELFDFNRFLKDADKSNQGDFYLNFVKSDFSMTIEVLSPDTTKKELVIPNIVYGEKNRTFPTSIEAKFEENRVRFNYGLISHDLVNKKVYSYKLERLDHQWSSYSTAMETEYTFLPEGKYVFKAKCLDQRGNIYFSKPIPILILPPWYRTWWFYTLEGLLALGLVGLVLAGQRRRLKRKNLEKIKEIESKRQHEELEYAREVQFSMLPKENIDFPDIKIVGFMQTASEVGGDFYDYFELNDNQIAVILGDATGHGVGAGLMVGMIKSAVTQSLNSDIGRISLPEIMQKLNQTLRRSLSQRGLGMCLSIAIINRDSGRTEICSVGLPYPYHYAAKTQNLTPINLDGPPLGLMKNIQTNLKTIILRKDDLLILLSDGLPERMRDDDAFWGYDEMGKFIGEVCQLCLPPDEIIKKVINKSDLFAAGRPNEDDMTMVVVRKDKI